MKVELDKNWHTHKGWSTHMPMLLKTVLATKRTCVEVGGGLYSTPLLHWLCREKGIKLISYENDEKFYEYEHGYKSSMHKVKFITNWDDMPVDDQQYGVVFIDHHPAKRRGTDVLRFKDSADFIVLHDSDKETTFGYDKVWDSFKYRFNWTGCHPNTTVLSNFIDLKFLEEKL
jgi:hypothetical protein